MRESKWDKILTKEFLYNNYIILNKTIGQISKELNIKKNYLAMKLKTFGIKKKERFKHLTKEYLIEEYINKKRTIREIIKEHNIGRDALKKIMEDFGIKTQINKRSEQVKNYYNSIRSHHTIPKTHLSKIKRCAKYRNIYFDESIDLDYLWNLYVYHKGRCALSGVEISFHKMGERQSKTTASLDRIDSSKGYVKENIQWVHKDIQRMKWAFNQSHFIDFCTKIGESSKYRKILFKILKPYNKDIKC